MADLLCPQAVQGIRDLAGAPFLSGAKLIIHEDFALMILPPTDGLTSQDHLVSIPFQRMNFGVTQTLRS